MSKWMVLAAVLVCQCSAPRPEVKSQTEPIRIALIGHLYSAYVHSQTTVGVHQIERTHTLEALARELAARQTHSVFFLGDITTDSRQDEWEMLEGIFGDLKARRYLIAGNHDFHDAENFYRFGGLKGHHAEVIGNSKFLMLGLKNWFEPEDLAWLRQEVSDHDAYDHVFVLMHYYLRDFKAEPKPGEDVNKPYNGVSNWKRDVLPILQGKVSEVFCGDLRRPEGAMLIGQRGNPKRLNYIMTSFLFSGEGPLIYLELTLDGDEVTIYPRAVPVDLRDPWYDPITRRPPKE